MSENKTINPKLEAALKGIWDSLTDEQKEKAKNCKTMDELTALAAKEGIELPDEVLDAVAGGLLDLTSYCEANSYTRSFGMGASCRVMECILR